MARLTRLRAATAITATTLALAACGGGSTQGSGSDNELQFAVISELTGKYAPFGLQLKAGVDAAVKDLNSTGEYDFTIKPKFYDCQSEQSICVGKTREAVTSDEMPLVMGPVVSLDVLPAAEVTERAEVPHLVFATLPSITEDYSNTFRWSSGTNIQSQTTVDYVAENLSDGDTVAIVHANTEFGIDTSEELAGMLEKSGNTPVLNIGHDTGQADYTPIMVELNKQKPKYVLLLESDPADVAKLLRQARETGLNSEFIGADAAGAVQLAGADAQGYKVVSWWFPNNALDANSAELTEKFMEAGAKDPGWVAAMAYDAVRGVAEAAKSNGFTAADLTAGLEGLDEMQGASATWTFGPDDRLGLKTMTVAEWTGDGFETVYPSK